MIYVMSGGGTKLFAAIGVTFPANSTVTCTNGKKTLTAKPKSDNDTQWVFAIPEAGTWTVTATDKADSTKTKSKEFEITKENQWESVILEYAFDLIKNGVEQQAFTKDKVTVSTDVDVLTVGASEVAWDGARRYYYIQVDVTNYNTLSFDGWYANGNGGYAYNSNIRAGVLIGSSYNKATAEYIFTSTTEGSYSIDVSKLSGNYYISIFAVSMSTSTEGNKWVSAKIKNLRLEQ